MKTSEVCYVCGSRGASCILYVRQQGSGVSYFSFLESHVPPRGARKPDSDGAVSACTVCSAFLNQQWDTFERTRTPLIKRLYWLKRIDNGAFTGAEMSVQGEYVAQLMGLHGGISVSSGGNSPFEYGNHAGISCGKPDLLASDDEESIASDSTNGALDLSVSPQKQDRQARKRGQMKITGSMGVGSKKRFSSGVTANIVCYICGSVCHYTLARFIYAFKNAADEPHFPFLLDLSPPAGAMQLTKTGVTQVCADCRKTMTRQWRSYESRGIREVERVYRVNDVAYPERQQSLQETLPCDRKQKSAASSGCDICYLCGQPDGATCWIATRAGCEAEMVLPFVAQLKFPAGARPIGVDGRTRVCRLCFVHMKDQWQKFDADGIPQEKRTFVLRPIAKTSCLPSANADGDVMCKQNILANCPVLATVLSSDTRPNSEQLHSSQNVMPQKLKSDTDTDDADSKASLAVALPNGSALTNGTSTSTLCYVCGLDCSDITVVGKTQPDVRKLYASPVDVYNASSSVDTKESLSLPFFPFLAHISSQSHVKAASPRENSVQSCIVCYENLHQQWQRFETSSDADERHRWRRQYTYKTVVCDVCHTTVERREITVVSSEQLQSASSSVDGLSLVCQQCCQSRFSPEVTPSNKSLVDSEHTSKDSITVSIHAFFLLHVYS